MSGGGKGLASRRICHKVVGGKTRVLKKPQSGQALGRRTSATYMGPLGHVQSVIVPLDPFHRRAILVPLYRQIPFVPLPFLTDTTPQAQLFSDSGYDHIVPVCTLRRRIRLFRWHKVSCHT
jgi:hypothetical protein